MCKRCAYDIIAWCVDTYMYIVYLLDGERGMDIGHLPLSWHNPLDLFHQTYSLSLSHLSALSTLSE